MNAVINELKRWHCDVDAALERMLGDEEFYIECLTEVSRDNSFEALYDALKSGDANAAFEAAHSLKGVLGNVGITPMYEVTVQIVEPLRIGKTDNLTELYVQLMELRQHLENILSSK